MKKILVIEDNTDIRENTAEILELANYKVFTATNGKTGIEIALREKPAVIICDIMLPILDGYGVLHVLQKNPEIRNIPFIFLTAKSERNEVRKGMELGANDYITKPFEETELLHAIESQLKKTDLIKQDMALTSQDTDGFIHASSNRDILKLLTENRDVDIYQKKQIIYSEGNRPSKLFYILKGKIKTYKTNDIGKELIVGLHKEEDFLGYVALLEGTSYKETAEAIETVELAVIPKAEFDKLINTSSELARKFITLLAQNVSEYEKHLLCLADDSLRKKVADALLTLQRKYTDSINISRENIAAVAGTATESLIRTLGDFKSEKLIDIRDGKIIILNERKLANMIN